MSSIKRERLILRGRPSLLVSLGPRTFFAANAALGIAAVSRAVDYIYLTYLGVTPKGLTAMEHAAPLWVWAILLLTGATLMLIGSLDPPRLLTLAYGHAVLCVVWTMIGTGVLAQALSDDIPGGWRGGLALLFGVAVMHFLFGISTFVRWKALLEIQEQMRPYEEG